jgi:hypothetical protein
MQQLIKIEMYLKVVVFILCGVFTNFSTAFCSNQDTVVMILDGSTGKYRNDILEDFLTNNSSKTWYNITLQYSTEFKSNQIHVCYKIIDSEKILICNLSSTNYLTVFSYDLSSVNTKPLSYLYSLEGNQLIQITLDDFSFTKKMKKVTIWYRFEKGNKVITRQWKTRKSSDFTIYRNPIVVKHFTNKIRQLTGVNSLLLSSFEEFYGVKPSQELKAF